jgi:hypothetical protein
MEDGAIRGIIMKRYLTIVALAYLTVALLLQLAPIEPTERYIPQYYTQAEIDAMLTEQYNNKLNINLEIGE